MKKVGSSCTFVLVLMAGAIAAGCSGSGAHNKDPKVASGGAAGAHANGAGGGGAACKAPSAAERAASSSQASSTIAVAKVGAGAGAGNAKQRVAFIADEDAKAILTFDLDTQAQIAQTHLDGTPSQIWIARDGRIFTTLRDKNELVVLSASRGSAPLTRLCSVQTPPEPVAITATSDEATILVATGWGQKLVAFESATITPKFETHLPREPRSVVVGDDGKAAFVSHAVGSIVSVVDLVGAKHETHTIPMRGFEAGQLTALKQQREMLEQLKKQKNTPGFNSSEMVTSLEREAKKLELGRPSCQGFVLAKSSAVAGRIFAPQVMVDPGDFEQRPDGYGNEHSQTEVPAVAVIDEGAELPLTSSVMLGRETKTARFLGKRQGAREDHPECLLPRAAAIDTKTKSLLVTCFGIDAVVAYDATAANPFQAERRRWTVGSGPNGVAIDGENHRAVVWSQFDRTMSMFPVGDAELVDEKVAPLKVQKVAAAALDKKLPAEYALGRILFHATSDSRISADGRACASCHPDGRDDAITWATPEGPRRSIMLAGRASRTAPYSWNGNESSLHNHLGNTFDRLSGKGLRSIELDALVTYISEMPAPPAPMVDNNGSNNSNNKSKVDRGRVIFTSTEAGCSSCHSGASFTDGKNHDVGSKHKADRGAAFNTPSLHLVGGAGPYFHDGRYATLSDLLRKSDGQMGKTKHLTNADLDALEAFLGTL